MSTDTPQGRLREQLWQKRTDFILEAAEAILIRKGYSSVSMDEIAAQAGVAKGTLYQHFPTKEDLFFALIEKALIRFEQVIQQAILSGKDARQKLEHILSYVYGEHWREHAYLLQLLRKNEDLNRRLLAKKERSGERIDQVIGQIHCILEEGKTEGLFTRAIATDIMVHMFLLLLSFAGDEYAPDQPERTPEELIPQLEHLLFQGIQSS
ncbi:MAG TPA: TetR/AcrR family transcriptional regulator [Ktedonobacteraceae bacterium]|nr:TetR/AcrR family transcriptional regulator [Ktedonobacteraceae bacterium]